MIRKEAKIVAILLCALTYGVIIFLGYLKRPSKLYLDNEFGNGFYVSLTASFVEDIIFFGVIGFAIYITSIRTLEDESFETRLKSIANSKKVGEQARENLSKNIRELLSYNRKREICITINEYNPTEGYIKVHCDMKNYIRNMCKDVKHPLVNANAYVEPGVEVMNSFGYISLLEIKDSEKESVKKTFINQDIVQLQRTAYRENVEFFIEEDGEAIWDFCFTIYNQIGDDVKDPDNWFYCISSRYTQDLSLTLKNEDVSNQTIMFDVEYNSRVTGQEKPVMLGDCIIHGGETKLLFSGVSQLKRDKVRIFFKT